MESSLLNLYQDILDNGEMSEDRTGTGTLSVFGRQLRFDLRKGFPAVTTKKLAWKPVVGELLWFLEGSSSNKRLAELTGCAEEKTIWYPNYSASYWEGAGRPKYEGDLGPIYGVQWRDWKKYDVKYSTDSVYHDSTAATYFGAKVTITKVDQLAQIIETIKTNPKSRRMVMTAFNVGELDQMVLPPCHMFTQFHVQSKYNDRCENPVLNQQVYIRSNDMFLGAPFNIASYALLQHMIAHVTGLDVGELILTIGDAHIYMDHIDAVKEQLTRTPYTPPTLWLNPEIKNIDDFKMDDIRLDNYESHPPIKAKMSA